MFRNDFVLCRQFNESEKIRMSVRTTLLGNLGNYKAKYQENFEKHIKPFLNEDELAKEPGKLVHLARFLDEFQMVLAEVGINKDELQIYQVVS